MGDDIEILDKKLSEYKNSMEKGAANGNLDDQYMLAMCTIFGWYCRQPDVKKGIKMLHDCAQKGSVIAMAHLLILDDLDAETKKEFKEKINNSGNLLAMYFIEPSIRIPLEKCHSIEERYISIYTTDNLRASDFDSDLLMFPRTLQRITSIPSRMILKYTELCLKYHVSPSILQSTFHNLKDWDNIFQIMLVSLIQCRSFISMDHIYNNCVSIAGTIAKIEIGYRSLFQNVNLTFQIIREISYFTENSKEWKNIPANDMFIPPIVRNPIVGNAIDWYKKLTNIVRNRTLVSYKCLKKIGYSRDMRVLMCKHIFNTRLSNAKEWSDVFLPIKPIMEQQQAIENEILVK